MRTPILLVTLFFFAMNLQAQLNDYKYIVVPKKFDAFKKENKHETSTLVKHLFSSQGFITVYDGEQPDELYANPCSGLKVKLIEKSSMFTTKATLALEDCKGNSIFQTQEGRSKEKDYKISYKEAITEAFESIAELNYSYNGKNEPEIVTLSYKNDVKNLNEESVNATARNTERSVVRQVATEDEQSYESKAPKDSKYVKGTTQNEPAVRQVATQDEQSYKDSTPVQSTMTKAPEIGVIAVKPEDLGVLYAQELPTGFQLVDSSPKIVMTLYKTSMKDVYAAKFGSINGLVFQNDGRWLFDYTEGQALIQTELNIKF